jgi:hypothetical protein
MHIHVERGEYFAKIWLDDFTVAETNMPDHLLRMVIILVRKNEKNIRQKWQSHFQITD